MKFLLSLVLLLTSLVAGHMQAVSLAWDASPDDSVGGYRLYYGETSGVYFGSLPIPNMLETIIEPAWEGEWFFAATAIQSLTGLESRLSNEVSWHCPLLVPTPLGITALGTDRAILFWPAWTKASLSPRHAHYTLQVVSSDDLLTPKSEWKVLYSFTDLNTTSVDVVIDRTKPAQYFTLTYTTTP